MKLYVAEEGHEAVRGLDLLAVSRVARVEVPGAIWRKRRIGDLVPDEAAGLVAQFEADYLGTDDEPPRFSVIDLTDAVLDGAAQLLATHALRAYAAMQLASALAARHADPECATFGCFDEPLREAAAVEGFALVP